MPPIPRHLQAVLIVEDDRDSAEITALLLRQLGLQVTIAHTYRAALALATAARFDVVISDLSLEDGDGCDLITELKTMFRIHAIALTGHGYPQDREHCANAGFDAFLLKPVTIDELTKAVSAGTPTAFPAADMPATHILSGDSQSGAA